MRSNWPTKKLGEVCEISAGGSAPQGKRFFENGEYPFFRTSDVGAVHLSDNLYDVRDYLNGQGIKGLNLFKKETILFPKSGASTFLNHRVIMGCDGYVASHLATISAGKNIDFRYLYLFLILVDAKDIAPNSSYPSLRITDIGKINIPLPPLEIQKKNVKKIEELFAKITQAQSLRESATQDTNDLIPATLSKIFEEGKSKGWEEKSLGEICEKNSNINWGEHKNDNFQYIDLSSVSRENFSITETKEVNSKNAPSRAKKIVNANDVIFGTTRPTLMRVTIIPPEYNNHICSTGFVVLRARKEHILPQFIYYFIRSERFMDRMGNIQTGASYPAVSDAKVMETKIPLPPHAEQKKIVERLDALTQKVRTLQTLQSQTASDLTALKQSILHKAFQGEL